MHPTLRARAVAVLCVAAIVAGCGSQSPSPSRLAGSGTAAATSVPSGGMVVPTGATSPDATGSVSPASPTAGSTASSSPSGAPTTGAATPVVPVGDFRTTATSVGPSDVAAILAGTSKRYDALELVATDADPILAALHATRAAGGSRLILAATPDALATDLAADRSRLGFIRASQVGPAVRALAWSGKSLFGVTRIKALGAWPLVASLPAAGSASFDPSRTWTVVAGGDMIFDRGVYRTVKLQGKGVDYPFAGGSATITSRYCCSSFGWQLPRAARTGNAGAVRALVSGANIAMANLEGPAPNKASYHTEGTTFTFDQALLAGLQHVGLDFVSLANNHIGNAGGAGIVQTVAALDRLGVEHAGAGANASAANAPALFTVSGVRVAVLGFNAIGGPVASASGPGVAPLSGSAATAVADIRAARAAGAQLVVVYPHWGVEYKATAPAQVRTWAHAMIDAGADLIIGNHPHWAGAMEVYKGKPIWYALGNFVFDQTWSEPTEEGLILELTFSGSKLVQAWLHPTLILDSCQPNLLDPAGSGKVVLDQVYGASKGLLPW